MMHDNEKSSYRSELTRATKLSYKEMIKWIFAASEIDTCCEATGGAQCCREGNWARWCAKPPPATANDRNPREEEQTIE